MLYTEKHRPKNLGDVILPSRVQQQLDSIVADGKSPNLLFSGSCGTGKTSAAMALVSELTDNEPLVINGSLEGHIDTLRTDIRDFVCSMSLSQNLKYVILDEGDHLSSATQAALRNFMEAHSGNARFIITANYPSRIIDPIRSRCSEIPFIISDDERKDIMYRQLQAALKILDIEGIVPDVQESKLIAKVIMKHFPDFRRVLNALQIAGHDLLQLAGRSLDVGGNFFSMLQSDTGFVGIRKWIAENVSPSNVPDFFSSCYAIVDKHVSEESVPAAIVLLAQYQHYASLAADHELNLAALACDLDNHCNWR